MQNAIFSKMMMMMVVVVVVVSFLPGWWESQNERDHWEDISEWIILK
jgi:hypothetical protein